MKVNIMTSKGLVELDDFEANLIAGLLEVEIDSNEEYLARPSDKNDPNVASAEETVARAKPLLARFKKAIAEAEKEQR